MAYFNEIKNIIKTNTKEYFEIIIRDTFFVIEGCFEIMEFKREFLYLKGKKDIMLIHGECFELKQTRCCEYIFSGCIYKLERKSVC